MLRHCVSSQRFQVSATRDYIFWISWMLPDPLLSEQNWTFSVLEPQPSKISNSKVKIIALFHTCIALFALWKSLPFYGQIDCLSICYDVDSAYSWRTWFGVTLTTYITCCATTDSVNQADHEPFSLLQREEYVVQVLLQSLLRMVNSTIRNKFSDHESNNFLPVSPSWVGSSLRNSLQNNI